MYIDVVPNRKSRPAILLRKAKRVGKKIVKTTLENLTDWPQEKIAALQSLLRGETLIPRDSAFTVEKTTPHGHVEAVMRIIRKLKLDQLISAGRCRQRDLILAMLVQHLIHPCSKLATTRLWHSTTLAEELSVEDADSDELYGALDWLFERQPEIEKKLAKRHLTEGALVLYDVSSSYYEGHTCPLIAYGHNRDGKEGMPIIVYGVMTDQEGRPLAVQVYPGNTGDPATVADQMEKLRDRFGLSRVVLVGDRGMLTQTRLDTLREYPGIGWISALKSHSIRKLVEEGELQLSLFDTRNLAEITSENYPGERLIACMNPLLAEERRRKREDLLAATEKHLLKIAAEVKRRSKKPLTESEIGLKVGKVLNRYKMGKHFTITIAEGLFQWQRKAESIEREAKLDGIYVIRTSEPKARVSAEDTVRHYKSLSHVERAFRCLKGMDIMIRPIRHATEDHVRAHVFLCMLAYYVQWHMRKALAPALFDDEELDKQRMRRDAVAPAEPSESAKKKKKTLLTDDGYPVHSFDTLLEELGTRCRNRCRINLGGNGHVYYENTEFTPFQKRVFQLLDLFPVKAG